jgi:hypothetical protein
MLSKNDGITTKAIPFYLTIIPDLVLQHFRSDLTYILVRVSAAHASIKRLQLHANK